MSMIMEDANLPTATFLSLDVEGSEEFVARTFAPAAFAVIMVEANQHDAEKNARVDALFREGGMSKLDDFRTGLNDVYVRSDLVETFRAAMTPDEPLLPA